MCIELFVVAREIVSIVQYKRKKDSSIPQCAKVVGKGKGGFVCDSKQSHLQENRAVAGKLRPEDEVLTAFVVLRKEIVK
jgi:hypothetical protein